MGSRIIILCIILEIANLAATHPAVQGIAVVLTFLQDPEEELPVGSAAARTTIRAGRGPARPGFSQFELYHARV